MRIQHNIAALNSYRQLSGNNNALSKNLEKLSSGYKINRAGDDAAGLAISEKMRAQIKGLEAAQKNANDGISLVQTAEGALTEVHSMLNRMVYLATQSANGTYDNDVDRANLQKEVTSLKDEIDRISKSTNFNGIKLLDGSLGMNTSAITNITSTSAVSAGATTSALTFENVDPANYKGKTEQAAKFTVDFTNMKASDNADGTKTVSIKLGTLNAVNVAVAAGDGADEIATKFAAALAAQKTEVDISAAQDGSSKTDVYVIDGTAFTMGTAANGKIEFTQFQNANNPAYKNIADGVDPDYDIVVDDTTNTVTALDGNKMLVDVSETQASRAKTDGQYASTDFKLDFANMKDGTTIKVGNTTYEFKFSAGHTVSGTNTAIDLSGFNMDPDNLTAANKADITTTVVGAMKADPLYQVSNKDAASGTIRVVEKKANYDAMKATPPTGIDLSTADKVKASISQSTATAASNAKTTFDVDTSKLVCGDKIEIDGKVYEFVDDASKVSSSSNTAVVVAGLSSKAGTATGDAAAALATAAGGTASGNTVTLTAAKATDKAPTVGTSGVKLQVGDTADEFNKVNVKVGSMDTKSLDIDDIDISTQEGASAAIAKIKDAINTVSSTRGDLGAIQNRLEHTINNLGVQTENITAAESRIRDTDMAEEMMAYTKNNILVQAAQAMLAQANQVPQGVLQLLQ